MSSSSWPFNVPNEPDDGPDIFQYLDGLEEAAAARPTTPPKPRKYINISSLEVNPPEPLLSQLLDMGLPEEDAKELSKNHIEHASQFKWSLEPLFRREAARRARTPRGEGSISPEDLVERCYEYYLGIYEKGVKRWAGETIDIARAHIAKLKALQQPRRS
jgi:hypothetical protein